VSSASVVTLGLNGCSTPGLEGVGVVHVLGSLPPDSMNMGHVYGSHVNLDPNTILCFILGVLIQKRTVHFY